MMSRILQLPMRVGRKAMRFGPIGRPLSAFAYRTGMTALSRRISQHSRYVPARVGFDVPDRAGNARRAWISGVDGTGGIDNVARMVWLCGIWEYEAPLPRVYDAAVRASSGAIFEVGANSGLYPIIAAQIADPASIHAFEPFPPALESLRANLALNGLAGRVNVIPKAAGAEPGDATLYVPSKKHGDVLETSASLRADFKGSHGGTITVPVITLDHYVQEAGIKELGVLKLDVEGFEASVMRGATGILRTLRPLVFVEVLKWKSPAPELEEIRAQTDYRSLWLLRDRLVARPQVETCEHEDNQMLYPPEKEGVIEQIAARLKVPFERA